MVIGGNSSLNHSRKRLKLGKHANPMTIIIYSSRCCFINVCNYLYSEIYEAGASTDEEVQQEKEKNERKLEHIRRRTLHKITTPQRIMKEVVTIDGAKQSLASVSILVFQTVNT